MLQIKKYNKKNCFLSYIKFKAELKVYRKRFALEGFLRSCKKEAEGLLDIDDEIKNVYD